MKSTAHESWPRLDFFKDADHHGSRGPVDLLQSGIERKQLFLRRKNHDGEAQRVEADNAEHAHAPSVEQGHQVRVHI